MIRVEELPAVSRATLREAIEAGILAAAEHPSFEPPAAEKLRAVGDHADLVAVGIYAQAGNGLTVRCPVAVAFPGTSWANVRWDLTFSVAFDGAMRAAGVSWDHVAARIVDGEVSA